MNLHYWRAVVGGCTGADGQGMFTFHRFAYPDVGEQALRRSRRWGRFHGSRIEVVFSRSVDFVEPRRSCCR